MSLLRQSVHAALRRVGLQKYRGPNSRVTFSQFAEDLLVWKTLQPQPGRPGFYVDVGAHHPSRLSNTKIFYDYGWSGINIDPLPAAAELFAVQRPRDLFIAAGVAAEAGELTYHMFRDPAQNSFHAGRSDILDKSGADEVERIGTRTVPVMPLAALLDEHLPGRLPAGRRIDFLNVDVEGLDEEVLASNDWSKYRPRAVLAEVHLKQDRHWIRRLGENSVVQYLQSQGYGPVAHSGCTALFLELDDE
ncbi:MAG: FkbM family methyltransferase [Planctomycetota bacterium]